MSESAARDQERAMRQALAPWYQFVGAYFAVLIGLGVGVLIGWLIWP